MDTEGDTKPFFSPIRGFPGFQDFQAAPPPPPLHAARAAPEQQAVCVLNQAASELSDGRDRRSCPDERLHGTSTCSPPRSASRIGRKFWSAGDYEAAGTTSAQPPRNEKNRMCVHPKFLHSNATSHKWAFGAVAELLDNAVDEMKNGATKIIVDKVVDKRNGLPALLIQDDGGGMDPDTLRRCMSFGFSDKQSGSSIGEYGNGFKTSTMRLGADAIVFSRCMKNSEPTQSIGLLSYTFLVETDKKDVVIPMVDYKCNLFSGEAIQYDRRGADQFSKNLSVLLKWSPFATEEELVNNFNDIGSKGTKIIVFNLWSNDDGDLELDFDTNEEDIMISGAPKPVETKNAVKMMDQNHLANQLRYSLRVYASVLYLQLPGYFKIILRGQEVKRHSIVTDLRYNEVISYKPRIWDMKEAEVITTIGFLKESPTVSVHGFNIYHRNRLILPFHRVLSNAGSKGRGVVGVLEANFIKPTHDKQDFEKSQVYQKLINRLKDMTNEYWDLHSHLIGYHKVPRAPSISPAARAMLPIADTMANSSQRNAAGSIHPIAGPIHPVAPSGLGTCDNPSMAIPIAFSPHPLSILAGTKTPALQTVQVSQTGSSPMASGTYLAGTRKRKNDTPVQMDFIKRQVTHNKAGNNSVDNQVGQHMTEGHVKELSALMQEQKQLREECSELEMAEEELLVKAAKLRLEIQHSEAQYKSLLNEYISVTSGAPQKR